MLVCLFMITGLYFYLFIHDLVMQADIADLSRHSFAILSPSFISYWYIVGMSP